MTPLRGVPAAFAMSSMLLCRAGWAESPCDASAGAQVFSDKCATCHSAVAGQPGAVGPNLFGVMGRRPASLPGFAYSASMRSRLDPWTAETLDWYLTDPPGRVPGTYMAFSGLKNESARAAVICFLKTIVNTRK